MNIQQPSPLIDETEWKTMFSKEEYKKCKTKDSSLSREVINTIKNHSLKYLIALDEPTEKIVQFINNLKKSHSPQLTTPLTKYQFTPLIIATMKGRLGVVEALVDTTSPQSKEREALMEAKDAYGWTALHHAALGPSEMMRLLLEKGANSQSSNLLGGTFTHLRKMAGLRNSTKTYEKLFYRPLGGPLSQITLEEFQHLTQLQKYSDEPIYPLNKLHSLWTSPPQEIEPVNQFLEEFQKKIYQKMIKNPPQLIVKEEAPGSFGLYAGEDLEFMQGIIEYTGKIIEESYDFFETLLERKGSNYQVDDIDAKEIGNGSRFSNDGPPNAGLIFTSNHGGRSMRPFLVVLDPKGIKKGEPILWDYSVGDVKLKWNIPYTICQREAMHLFYKENPLEKLAEEYDRINQLTLEKYLRGQFNGNDWYPRSFIQARVFYPYSTPAALIDLVSRRLIKPKELKSLLNSPCIAQLNSQSQQHMLWINNLIDLMQNLNDHLDALSLDLEEDILSFITENIGKMTTIQVIHGIQKIDSWLMDLKAVSKEKRNLVVKKNWSSLKKDLSESLPLCKEPPFPIGLKGYSFDSGECSVS